MVWFQRSKKPETARIGGAPQRKPVTPFATKPVPAPPKTLPASKPAPLMALPAVPPAQAVRTVVVVNNDEPIITLATDVPKGRYVPFAEIEADKMLALTFAVIVTQIGVKGGARATILAASEAAFTHPRFALEERVKAHFDGVEVRHATREVIEHIHAQYGSATATPDTEVETYGWDLVKSALELRASDIHIPTRGTYAEVFFRIHGRLVQQPDLSKATAEKIGSVWYAAHADANSKETQWDIRKPLDTSINHDFETVEGGKRTVQLRFASGPIVPTDNFEIVMRVQDMTASYVALEDVGYTEEQMTEIRRMLIGSRGGIFLVGPTNSGKSRSMVSFILTIQERRGGKAIKVLTIEKPVEFVIPGAVQVSVKDDAAFKANMRSVLRRDSDVVMIGEVRDEEEMEIVKNLILTGRKLLTTIHVTNAMTVFTRLRELHVPDSVLYREDFVSGIIYQRLLPLVCEHCGATVKEARENGWLPDDLFARLKNVADIEKDSIRFVRVGGCAKCLHTGIKGRTPCAEVLRPTREFFQLMRKGDEDGARRLWESNDALNVDGRGVTAIAHAIRKMRQGLVDPRDVEEEIDPLDTVVHIPAQTPRPVAAIEIEQPRRLMQIAVANDALSELPPALRPH